MIEMRVRQVSHHAPSGSDVVVLEAAQESDSPMTALAVSRADAQSPVHELEHEATPRSAVPDQLRRAFDA